MNRRSLMISTMLMSAMGVGGVVGNVWAASCAVTDCAALGYTESYNSSGNCLKCPFGEAYNCEAGYICPDNYTQECTGTGEIGVGEACDGKYAECACKEGYKWENGQCKAQATWGQCSGYAALCSLGDILFSDGTCSANKVSGKTPIAVVVYKSSDGKCGQAMTLKSIGSYEWSDLNAGIMTLTDYDLASAASKDYDSCLNTGKIMAEGNKSTYPAAWAAHEYKIVGTEAGDWCLPAAGILNSIYNNQSTINTGLKRANGTQFIYNTYVWSSSQRRFNLVWSSRITGEYGLEDRPKSGSLEVRPVIEF